MKLGNFFHAFQPKDKVFYGLFEKITDNLIAMSGEFMKDTKNEETINIPFLDSMKAYEHKNDDLTHEIYTELNRNFITPFDREDIYSLLTGLDDIADYIYASTKNLVLYKVPYRDVYQDFARIIHDACIEVARAMKNLRGLSNFKEVEEACIKIHSLENEADRLFTDSMVELFESDDAIKIIKISSVLKNLEITTDKAEEVANIIQGVMIKYS